MTASLPAILDFPFDSPPPPGEAREVAPGVLWLRMPLPFALDHINLWLLAGERGWTLVDTGYGDAATRDIWEQHATRLLASGTIEHIVATHYHPDHAGNAAWLSRRFDCAVAMTHTEFLTAHSIHAELGSYTPDATLDLFRAHGLAADALAALRRRGNSYRRGAPELPHTFERLLHGQAIEVGGIAWHVIVGHGHSPEHASLHAPALGVLIAGDMLLPRISTNVSVWPVEPAADPVQRFVDSLEAFEALAPDTLVLPSHGLPFRGIAMRVAALRSHHAARLDELAAALRQLGRATAADVVPVLFKRTLDLQQQFFAMGEAIAHLNRLWHAGRAHRVADAGVLRFIPSD